MGTPNLSEKARERILAAQKRRWEAFKTKQEAKATAVVKAGPVPLQGMNVAMLGEMLLQLGKVEEYCEKTSGIAATLKGIVLIRAKELLDHGDWLPWLGKYYPYTRKTSAKHMRLGRAFAQMSPQVTFQILQQDLASSMKLLEENRFDLKHPDVAAVAKWTKGRSAYQLLLDLGPSAGHQVYAAQRKDGTPRAERRTQEEIAEEAARDEWDDDLSKRLARWVQKKHLGRLDDARLREAHGLLLDLYNEARDLKTKRGLK